MADPDLQETVFVPDDDDEELDEWLDDSPATSTPFNPERVRLQLRVCFALLALVPFICALIVVSWRHFGPAFSRRRMNSDTPVTAAFRATLKKAR